MTKLEEAESKLEMKVRTNMWPSLEDDGFSADDAKSIADELDRLREKQRFSDEYVERTDRHVEELGLKVERLEAELAALKGEASCTRWAACESAAELLADPATYASEEKARKIAKEFGCDVFAVFMSARKVEP